MHISEAYIKSILHEHCLPFTPFKIRHKRKAVKKGDKTFYHFSLLEDWLFEHVY